MLAVLFLVECTGVCIAMSIAAWLGRSSTGADIGRTMLIRFLAPPFAVILGLVTLSDGQKWLMGEPVGDQPPLSWALVGGVVLAVSVAIVVAAVRRQRSSTHSLRRNRTLTDHRRSGQPD